MYYFYSVLCKRIKYSLTVFFLCVFFLWVKPACWTLPGGAPRHIFSVVFLSAKSQKCHFRLIIFSGRKFGASLSIFNTKKWAFHFCKQHWNRLNPQLAFLVTFRVDKLKLQYDSTTTINMQYVAYVKAVKLLTKRYILKCPYMGYERFLGVPNNRLTCICKVKKHFHFLIICIYFYLICSTTPKRFVQWFVFPNPSFAWR